MVDASKGGAKVEFFDGRALGDVDLSVVQAKTGDYVEVFGNMALSVLTPAEARTKKRAWATVTKAAMEVSAEASRR